MILPENIHAIKQHLKLLVVASPDTSRALLKTLKTDQLTGFSELALNALSGELPLTEEEKNYLRQHKPTLRKLAHGPIRLRPFRALLRGKKLIPILTTLASAVLRHFRGQKSQTPPLNRSDDTGAEKVLSSSH